MSQRAVIHEGQTIGHLSWWRGRVLAQPAGSDERRVYPDADDAMAWLMDRWAQRERARKAAKS